MPLPSQIWQLLGQWYQWRTPVVPSLGRRCPSDGRSSQTFDDLLHASHSSSQSGLRNAVGINLEWLAVLVYVREAITPALASVPYTTEAVRHRHMQDSGIFAHLERKTLTECCMSAHRQRGAAEWGAQACIRLHDDQRVSSPRSGVKATGNLWSADSNDCSCLNSCAAMHACIYNHDQGDPDQ